MPDRRTAGAQSDGDGNWRRAVFPPRARFSDIRMNRDNQTSQNGRYPGPRKPSGPFLGDKAHAPGCSNPLFDHRLTHACTTENAPSAAESFSIHSQKYSRYADQWFPVTRPRRKARSTSSRERTTTRPDAGAIGATDGTATTRQPAASAAATPVAVSSMTAQRSGAAPNPDAAVRYGSGCGLVRVTSSPATVRAKWWRPTDSSTRSMIRRCEAETRAVGISCLTSSASSRPRARHQRHTAADALLEAVVEQHGQLVEGDVRTGHVHEVGRRCGSSARRPPRPARLRRAGARARQRPPPPRPTRTPRCRRGCRPCRGGRPGARRLRPCGSMTRGPCWSSGTPSIGTRRRPPFPVGRATGLHWTDKCTTCPATAR